MIEYAALVSVLLAGDVDACLLVEPPAGESEVLGNLHGLFVDDSMWLEHRIDIAGDAGSVVGQGHSGAAQYEYVCHDASADETLTQRGECPFKLCPAEEDTVGLAHAASRSLADR
jgi:hypothetical protein